MRHKKIGGSLWFAFGVVVLIGIRGAFLGYDTVTFIVLGVCALGLAVGAYVTTHQKIRSDRNTNWHYPDVCENCDPVLMADASPIKDLVKYVAATRKITREDAQKLIQQYAQSGNDVLGVEFTKYLAQFKT